MHLPGIDIDAVTGLRMSLTDALSYMKGSQMMGHWLEPLIATEASGQWLIQAELRGNHGQANALTPDVLVASKFTVENDTARFSCSG